MDKEELFTFQAIAEFSLTPIDNEKENFFRISLIDKATWGLNLSDNIPPTPYMKPGGGFTALGYTVAIRAFIVALAGMSQDAQRQGYSHLTVLPPFIMEEFNRICESAHDSDICTPGSFDIKLP